MNLKVRELNHSDISLLVDYWLKSSPEHLVGMGVDLAKLPSLQGLRKMLETQLETPLKERQSYALIWELDAQAIGHSNINQITFGQRASMHLHLWQSNHRKAGLGAQLVKLSLPFYFEKFELEALFCEPYALNPAPNKTLQKLGFEFIKKYKTIPGSINFEQEVNQWKLSKNKFNKNE